MSGITPFLWYDGQAEQAAKQYVSILPNSRIVKVHRNGEQVFTVEFELDGRPFVALNGGPQYAFTEAFSLVVACRDQAEIDRYWAALGEGGSEGRCGWLKDRFGLSWQVVPENMGALIGGPDPKKAGRAMQAMFGMKKLDIEGLRRARGEA